MNYSTLRISADNFSEIAVETLSDGISIRFTANGRSMYPHILDGDIITVIPIDACGLRLGDVIMHRTGVSGSLVVHRIIKISPRKSSFIYTRGDAVEGPPQKVPIEDVSGRAVSIERNGIKTKIGSRSERFKSMLWVYRKTLRNIFRKYIPRKRKNHEL